LIGEFTVTLANPGTANDIAKDEIR
jgi:hypothetical protein